MLLNRFVNLGAPPPQEWLNASEIPLMTPISAEGEAEWSREDDGEESEEEKVRPEEAASLAMLSAAWSFQVNITHKKLPADEWGQIFRGVLMLALINSLASYCIANPKT